MKTLPAAVQQDGRQKSRQLRRRSHCLGLLPLPVSAAKPGRAGKI